MENRPNVVIVRARCSQSKQYFGIRFEEKEMDTPGVGSHLGLGKKVWVGDWSFAVDSQLSKREGYDKNEINGIISVNLKVYPGCPHCSKKLIFECSCGQAACREGSNQIVTCPSCGRTARLSVT